MRKLLSEEEEKAKEKEMVLEIAKEKGKKEKKKLQKEAEENKREAVDVLLKSAEPSAKKIKEEDMGKNIAIVVLVVVCMVLICVQSCGKKVVVPPVVVATPTTEVVGLGAPTGMVFSSNDVKLPEVEKNTSEKQVFIFTDDPCVKAVVYDRNGKFVSDIKIGAGHKRDYSGYSQVTLRVKVFKNGTLIGKYTEVFKDGTWLWRIRAVPQKTQDMSQLPS